MDMKILCMRNIMSKVVKTKREKIIGCALIFIIILRYIRMSLFFWDQNFCLCQKNKNLINQFTNTKNSPITTPSTLGPKALPNSGNRMGVDRSEFIGTSRRHFNKA